MEEATKGRIPRETLNEPKGATDLARAEYRILKFALEGGENKIPLQAQSTMRNTTSVV